MSLGYADGYPRALSNRGCAQLGVARVPVAGVVTMDMTMLDVTNAACALGDVATLIGGDAATGSPSRRSRGRRTCRRTSCSPGCAIGSLACIALSGARRVSRRAIVIVLDGVGAGAAPDAAAYGDAGSNTLGNLSRAVGGLDVPNLERLGLGHVAPLVGVAADVAPRGAWGRMRPASAGKDSTTGHWEICGVHLSKPFPTYPDGFPPEVIEQFAQRAGRGVLGNVAASGTEIIDRFGAEHVRTGKLIVYTSADSVFQVAAHEDVVPLDELYRACERRAGDAGGAARRVARHRAAVRR